MSLEQIWAPWRLGFIKGTEQPPATKSQLAPNWLEGADQQCFICRYVAQSADQENLVAHRGQQTVTMLNRYPYNNGHLLIAPQRHRATLADLSGAEQLECLQVMTRATQLLEELMNPQGFNVGLNLGRVAGAGLPGHLHWHVVPRWSGDTNFMPVLAGVSVVPQALEALWELLAPAFQQAGLDAAG